MLLTSCIGLTSGYLLTHPSPPQVSRQGLRDSIPQLFGRGGRSTERGLSSPLIVMVSVVGSGCPDAPLAWNSVVRASVAPGELDRLEGVLPDQGGGHTPPEVGDGDRGDCREGHYADGDGDAGVT